MFNSKSGLTACTQEGRCIMQTDLQGSKTYHQTQSVSFRFTKKFLIQKYVLRDRWISLRDHFGPKNAFKKNTACKCFCNQLQEFVLSQQVSKTKFPVCRLLLNFIQYYFHFLCFHPCNFFCCVKWCQFVLCYHLPIGL